MRPATSARIDADLAELLCGGGQGYWWIVDGDGRLLGCLDSTLAGCSEDPREIIASQHIEDMAMNHDASLKDALSVMLGSSARTIPVVDGAFRLVGEIGLDDVERAADHGKQQK